MKKYFILLFCVMLQLFAIGQPVDSLRYQQAMQRVQQAINNGSADAIYAEAASSFRAKMTQGQFATGMNKFKVSTGFWKDFKFKARTNRGNDYVANFELGPQLVSIKLNDQGQIERLNFATIKVAIEPKAEQAASTNPLKSNLDLQVEALVRPYIQKGNTAGLVLAVIKGDKTYSYSYGTINKAKTALPTDHTIFEIGSVTKTFTSLLLAQQVLKGNMELADPLSKYLPDSAQKPFTKSIRLVHLANHTSGFPRLPANIFNGNVNPKNPYLHYNKDSLYSFLVHYKQSNQPGTTFSYSNYAAGLLGTILETKLRANFGQLIRQYIAIPLNMPTTYVDLPANLQSNLAQGYNENGLPTSAWDLASLKGSGAIRSTLTDMITYTRAQMGYKSKLQQAINLSHQLTFNGPGQRMALGWRIDTVANHPYYHHSGGTGGFRSFVGFDTERKLGVVILSNAADEVTEIGQRILAEQ